MSKVSDEAVDKALMELWRLRGGLRDGAGLMSPDAYEKESRDIAFLAINVIQSMQEELKQIRG